MDSPRQSVILELFVYGSAEEPLQIHIINQEIPVIRRVSVEVIANVLTYLVYKLGLQRERLYLYCKGSSLSYFEPVVRFRGEGLFSDCNYQSILILYSEVDVTSSPDLQRFVESLYLSVFKLDIPMVEPQNTSAKASQLFDTSHLERQLSHSRSILSQRLISKQISSFRPVVTFTDNIAVEAKEMSSAHQPIYCRAPNTLPFSYVRGKLKPKDNLPSPCYFPREYFLLHCNSQQEIHVDELQQGYFELNKNNELVLINKEMIRNARGVIPDVIRQAAYLIFTGQGIFKLQIPIRLFDTKTMLQASVEFPNNLEYLRRASLAPKGVEMFKNVITFALSGFLYKLFLRKAFNPLLGETFQGDYPDGTKVYAEQIGHEPPESAILLVNDAFGFRVHGRITFEPKISGLEFRMIFNGILHAEIHGERFSYNYPMVVAKGSLGGERRLSLEGTMFFHYPNRNWKAYVHIGNPEPTSHIKGLICVNDNVLEGNETVLGSNLFGNIHKINQPKDQVLATITGSWMSQISFNGVEYWNRNQPSYKLQMGLEVLPSDSRFREDLNWYMRGNQELALSWKIKLEEVQREAQKSRAKWAKGRK
jgi:hypothetical protein